MENFPTPHLATVPRIANLLTLVFLVGTTWWSSAQRPVSQDATALLAAPVIQKVANKTSHLPVDKPTQAILSVASPAIAADGIIAVGFSGASLR